MIQSGISAAVVFIWKAVQNPASLSTGGAKITAKNLLFSQPPFVTTSTQNWCQYSAKTIRLCSNFLLLFLSSVIPSTPLVFFFPTATSMFTTPLKQHSTKTRLCRADKSLKNTRAAFCRELERGRWDMLNASYSCVKWKMPLDCLSHKGLTQL